MDEFKPSYVLYAHKSERYPNRAACVYLEKGDEDEDLLSFALLEKDDMGNVRIVDKASYSIDVEIYPKNFVSGDIKAVTAIGDAVCGLLFILKNTSEGIWELCITTESGFGVYETEECEVRIPFNWLPF